MRRPTFVAFLAWLAVAPACSTPAEPPAPPQSSTQPAQQPPASKAEDETLPPVSSPYDALPQSVRTQLDQPFTGDADEMIKRRLIRAGVVFNRTQYYIDRGEQRGLVFESIKLFEEQINIRLKTGKLPVHVAFVPLQRDQLFPALAAGKVDLVAAALTITPEREKVAMFSKPTRTGVTEIVVTDTTAAPLHSAQDLSGKDVFVRRSSSYYQSLVALNEGLQALGKPPVTIKLAPESLEDDDLLEMVNAGLVQATVVDDFVAQFWKQIFTRLQLHPYAALRTNGTIGVAVRPNSPILLKAINTWIDEYGPRTAFGNVVNKRYLQNVAYAKAATSGAEQKKFQTLLTLFQKYGEQYQLDHVLVAAQGYQESQLDHGARSAVGAIGVMQVMPATGAELAVGDISQLEPNIHAGVKYLRVMLDRYYKDDPMDNFNKALMTLASYNAGPGRVRALRREAASRGLDPNVWFGNVERIASERVGRETVQYVGNIYKYYVAYRLTLEQADRRSKATASTGG